ncbi:hypothetical protein O1L60_38625 [Streptomyces diastatochromogenes]|nr:hypothetical protein [Streptomyces diastatochromogenes]
MIEGYLGRESVVLGGEMTLHISTDAPRFRLRFYRLGETLDLVGESREFRGEEHPVPGHPDGFPGRASPADDWEWPPLTLPVPEAWTQGIHLVEFVETGGPDTTGEPPLLDLAHLEGHAREFFVVRPASPAAVPASSTRSPPTPGTPTTGPTGPASTGPSASTTTPSTGPAAPANPEVTRSASTAPAA